MEPVISWSSFRAPARALRRTELSAVSRFTDDEIDVLYSKLAALENESRPDKFADQRSKLLEKLASCEKERAAEMSALFWRRNPVELKQYDQLFREVDEFLSKP